MTEALRNPAAGDGALRSYADQAAGAAVLRLAERPPLHHGA
jgi:hypothetical protein